jgi:hypothetical protein
MRTQGARAVNMAAMVRGFARALAVLVLVLSLAPSRGRAASGGAASGKTSGHAKDAEPTLAKAKAKSKSRSASTSTSSAKNGKPTKTITASKSGKAGKASKASKPAKVVAEVKPPRPPTRASGKVAVLLFDGDGAAPLRARVVRLLRARGLKVTTTLRPLDSPEQYREMADTLNLAAFVDGEASEDGDQASVTVHLRSGISGLRIASATLAGARRELPGELDKSLWPQLGPPLAKVCVEAAKPRKREREPMRIEAGTPLDAAPADAARPL